MKRFFTRGRLQILVGGGGVGLADHAPCHAAVKQLLLRRCSLLAGIGQSRPSRMAFANSPCLAACDFQGLAEEGGRVLLSSRHFCVQCVTRDPLQVERKTRTWGWWLEILPGVGEAVCAFLTSGLVVRLDVVFHRACSRCRETPTLALSSSYGHCPTGRAAIHHGFSVEEKVPADFLCCHGLFGGCCKPSFNQCCIFRHLSMSDRGIWAASAHFFVMGDVFQRLLADFPLPRKCFLFKNCVEHFMPTTAPPVHAPSRCHQAIHN